MKLKASSSKADLLVILGVDLPIQMSIVSPKHQKRSWRNGKLSCRHMVRVKLRVCYFLATVWQSFFYLGASRTLGRLCWCSKEPKKWNQRNCSRRKVGLFKIVWCIIFEKFRYLKLIKTDTARRFHGSVYLTVQKKLCGHRSFFQKENIHTNFCFFFILVFVPSTVQHWTFPPCVC